MKKRSAAPYLTLSLIIGGILIVSLLGIFFYKKQFPNSAAHPVSAVKHLVSPFDFGNQPVMMDYGEIKFANGTFQSSDATHSATISQSAISQSGDRAAAILIDNPSGSGSFYYLVSASKIDDVTYYSLPQLLGDRINIQSVTIENPEAHDNGEIIVSYLDRKKTDPMSAEPSVPKTAKFSFEESGNLIEVLH
jgi:hypothetical protein